MELLIDNALNIGADEFYRSSRYGVPLVVMLINTQDRDAFNILESNVRQTDIIQQLESDMIIVFLSHTDIDESDYCIEKLKEKFSFTYTVKQFKGSEIIFLQSLFLENSEKIKMLWT